MALLNNTLVSDMLVQIKAEISKANNIAVFGHISPDPDAIGSVCALAECLENAGKNVFRVFVDPIPANLEFILNGKRVINYFPKEENVELLIFCDISSYDMIGKLLGESLSKEITSICIDHHESNTSYATINYVNSKASATCEIMYEVLNGLDFKITKSVASAMYAGLSADTGSFRFSSTTPYTFFVAGELLKLGADAYTISTNLWSSKSRKTIELEKVMLNRLEFDFENKFAISYITKNDMEKVGADKSNTSGLIGNIRDVEGVVLAALFYEEDENWKLSTRSKDTNISTLPITTSFGGGGHFMASGARLDKNLTPEEIVKKIKNIAKDLL